MRRRFSIMTTMETEERARPTRMLVGAAVALILAIATPSRAQAPAATRPAPPGTIHPLLEDRLFAGIAAGRSPFLLARREGRVPARVRAADPALVLREAGRLGLVVRAVVGPIVSLEVPEESLAELASLPGVSSVKP